MVDITEEKDRISGPPYWGKYIFHDNNRDINYSQVTMRAHLEWYLKTHPPVMHDLHESVPFLYTFSGPGAAEPESRSDRVRRAADVCQLRDDAAHQVRHARRVDARLRGHVVARLPRLHVVEPQRPGPDVRDVRQRRRDDDEAQGRAARGRRPDQPRVVSAAAAVQGSHVVDAQQHQLHADRRALGAAVRIVVPRRDASRTSTARAATASRPGRRRRRTRTSCRPDRRT